MKTNNRPFKQHVLLSDDQVTRLKNLLNSKSLNKTVKRRIQVLLDLDESHGEIMTRIEVAKMNRCSTGVVYAVINLFFEGGIDEAITIKRNSNSDHANQKLTAEDEAKLIALACGPAPEGYTRWSYSLLEEKSATILEHPVKRDAIARKLKKMKLNRTK